MLQVLKSHNTFGDYLFCHAKHKLFNTSTRKKRLQYFALEERNIILQNLTPKRLAVTLNLQVFLNQSGSCSDLFEKLLKSKTAIKERRHCIFRKYKIICLHEALTTYCTYMVEDGKPAPLYMVLLAWTVERKNGKNVQSAQIFCPTINEMKNYRS